MFLRQHPLIMSYSVDGGNWKNVNYSKGMTLSVKTGMFHQFKISENNSQILKFS